MNLNENNEKLLSGTTTDIELKKLGKHLFIKEEKENKEIMYWNKLDKIMETIQEINIKEFILDYSIMNDDKKGNFIFDLFEQNCLAFKKINYLNIKLNNQLKK